MIERNCGPKDVEAFRKRCKLQCRRNTKRYKCSWLALRCFPSSIKGAHPGSREEANFSDVRSAAKVTVDPPLRPIRSTALIKLVSILSLSN